MSPEPELLAQSVPVTVTILFGCGLSVKLIVAVHVAWEFWFGSIVGRVLFIGSDRLPVRIVVPLSFPPQAAIPEEGTAGSVIVAVTLRGKSEDVKQVFGWFKEFFTERLETVGWIWSSIQSA